MMNPHDIEACYAEYMENLSHYVPDGIFEVDLSLLQQLDLVNFNDEQEDDDGLSFSFYVVESPEKLTLFNTQFVVWIVPKLVEQEPYTYTLIALNEYPKPHLEMVFTTKGAYNQSNLILRILEKFLEEIEENEKEIVKFRESDKTS